MPKKKKRGSNNFYAVSRGRQVGIFKNWNFTSESVTGFKKAVHKAYSTLEEAKNAMAEAGISNPVIFDNGLEVSENISIASNDIEDKEQTKRKERILNDWDENSNQEEEKEESEDTHHHDHGNNDPEHDECICMTTRPGRTINCSKCNKRIHVKCTRMPVYQVCLYIRNRSRKYTCEICAEDALDEKVFDEVMQSMQVQGYEDENEEKETMLTDKHNDSISMQHSETKKTIQNLELAIINLSEHVHDLEKNLRERIDSVILANAAGSRQNHEKKRNEEKQQKSRESDTQTTFADFLQSTPTVKLGMCSETPTLQERNGILSPNINNDDVKSKSEKNKKKKKKNSSQITSSTSNKNTDRVLEDSPNNSFGDDRDRSLDRLVDDESNCESGESCTQCREESDDLGLPSVLIIHDSVLRDLDPERLGRRVGAKITKKQANTLSECVTVIQEMKCPTPEAIVISSGVNDLKSKRGEEACNQLKTFVNEANKKYPSTHVVINKLAPTKFDDIEARREVYNALNFDTFREKRNTSFVCNDNAVQIKPDGIHPTKRGMGVLARNMGQHLEKVLWQKIQTKNNDREKRIINEHNYHDDERKDHYRTERRNDERDWYNQRRNYKNNKNNKGNFNNGYNRGSYNNGHNRDNRYNRFNGESNNNDNFRRNENNLPSGEARRNNHDERDRYNQRRGYKSNRYNRGNFNNGYYRFIGEGNNNNSTRRNENNLSSGEARINNYNKYNGYRRRTSQNQRYQFNEYQEHDNRNKYEYHGFDRETDEGGYEREIDDHGHDREIDDRGYEREIDDRGYNREIDDCGYDREIDERGYDGEINDREYNEYYGRNEYYVDDGYYN